MNEQVAAWIASALDAASDGITVPQQRNKLKDALLLNCDDSAGFPFPHLGIGFVSERDFYRRKAILLDEIFAMMKVGKE